MPEKCNEKNCTCPHLGCVRHGKCCECINYHRSKGQLVYCMREIAKSQKK